MARGRLPMRMVKKVLEYHFDAGRSHRDIAIHCGVAPHTVALPVERFESSGLGWPEARDMEEGALEAALYPPPPPPPEDVDWAKVEAELSGRGVALRLLREEWRADRPGGMSYPTRCRRFRQRRRSQRAMTMRQVRSPGERLFVDYAGMTVAVTIDGVSREAQTFVASMGVSGLACAEAVLTRKIDDWCASHVRCFEAMGCVPLAVVPDNIKPAVTKPSRYEPVLNETYADLLEHYGAHGLPPRSRRPRDKAKVEAAVGAIQTRILLVLRHEIFFSLETMNGAIRRELDRLNEAPMACGESRRAFFEANERAHLQPLPANPWERGEWLPRKVGPNGHVRVERNHYSVPDGHVGRGVAVRAGERMIEVFLEAGGERIAVHRRKSGRNRYATRPEHMPDRLKAVRDIHEPGYGDILLGRARGVAQRSASGVTWCRSAVSFSRGFLVAACRIRSAACVTLSRLCVRRVLSLRGFPLVEALPSTDSAGARAPLFARFDGTLAPSDFFTPSISGFGTPSLRGPDTTIGAE